MNDGQGWSAAAIVGAGLIPCGVIAAETIVFCVVQFVRALRMRGQ